MRRFGREEEARRDQARRCRDADSGQPAEHAVEAVRRGQAAGLLAAVPTEQIALSCWGIAHGLVSLELAGTVPPGLDIGARYEGALWAMVTGWVVAVRPS
jgi:hypothetical protein